MVPFLSVNAEVLPHAPPKKSLPFQGRWLGEAETERLLQICDDLSVSLRLTAPLQGEPWMVHIPLDANQ